MDSLLEEKVALVHGALLERGETVACAESLTGGEVAAALSALAGASAVFVGGVVSYATEVKRTVLGVTADEVISAECAEQMARGVRERLGSDWAVSTTGVAGPDLQEGHPAGTVFIGIAGPDGSSAVLHRFTGDREQVRAAAVVAATEVLGDALA
jgi:nicotinamide-nucleotide amidase